MPGDYTTNRAIFPPGETFDIFPGFLYDETDNTTGGDAYAGRSSEKPGGDPGFSKQKQYSPRVLRARGCHDHRGLPSSALCHGRRDVLQKHFPVQPAENQLLPVCDEALHPLPHGGGQQGFGREPAQLCPRGEPAGASASDQRKRQPSGADVRPGKAHRIWV